jgi:1,4-dihydroxy-6-naphthoate synthase
MQLSLGFSPCPNDTFIFHALVHGVIDAGELRFRERLEDVETLNRMALRAAGATGNSVDGGVLDVTKVSYGAVPHLLGEFQLLRSGGALGWGCGPLLVVRPGTSAERLRRGRIAIPGRHTTANLLLRLWDPALPQGTEIVYSDIMPAVARGEVDAGLIIHESRFTYPHFGLERLVDLGEWWEGETGLPIPLGGIMARRSLGRGTIQQIETAIRRSLEHALANPDHSRAYVRSHAQEMDDQVVRQHIALYVNRLSLDLEEEGERAVQVLLRRATECLQP